MDRMLGSCAGHHRLWPLTSPLFHWTHQSDSVISVMSLLSTGRQFIFTSCDIGALESLPTVGLWQFLPLFIPLIMDRFDEKLPCITVVVVFSEQDKRNPKPYLLKRELALQSFQGMFNNATAVQFWRRQTVRAYFFGSDHFPGSVNRQRKRSVIVFRRWLKDLLTRLL